jgi:inorganic pyrophosphatase
MVVVEAPRGARLKLKYDEVSQVFVFERALPRGVKYPYDWGFVPSTLAADGDPLDAMVLFDAPTWPGVVIPAKPIGVLRVMQRPGKGAQSERNDRLLFVPASAAKISDVRELPKRARKELEEFFVTAVELTPKKLNIEGWEGPELAETLVNEAAARYTPQGNDATGVGGHPQGSGDDAPTAPMA